MMDLSTALVRPRLKDRASQHNVNLGDLLRVKWHSWANKNMTLGKGVIFKRGVQVSICQPGRLAIGDNSLFKNNCVLLLTMPHPKVDIGRNVTVGMNTVIASKNVISIGDFTIIAPNCYIIDHEHGFSGSDLIHNQRAVLKEVRIGRDCFIGNGSIVLGGVSIEDGAVIGAGSVVTRNVPAYEVWAGNPARFIKKRE